MELTDDTELLGSSPHTRGALSPGPVSSPPGRIIPAYAGSTTAARRTSSRRADHPRIRGEHLLPTLSRILPAGSSPHTRGAHDGIRSDDILQRIIPAYAGSTPAGVIVSFADCGSSPHTRGARPTISGTTPGVRIIPAYAGSTAHAVAAVLRRRDHPRIRGEHGPLVAATLTPVGSSPHTRGARDLVDLGVVGAGIIPAYAGSTQCGTPRTCRSADHPRIRGEHFEFRGGVVVAGGSSPHTRGAPAGVDQVAEWQGIIPAYAGSTTIPTSM